MRQRLVAIFLCSFASALVSGTLPAQEAGSVDLRPEFKKLGLKPANQGQRPTCSVFATTGALEFALSRYVGKGLPLSVEYLNWASNEVLRDPTDGGFFHDLLKGFERHGICPEADLPYQKQFDSKLVPSQPALANAKDIREKAREGLRVHWINPWRPKPGLTDEHLNQIKHTLAKGWPVAAGANHSRLLVGYRDDPAKPGGGVFITKDSAPGVYGEVTYEFVKANVGDVFWIEALTLESSNAARHMDEGNSYMIGKDYGNAVKSFTKALSLDPHSALAYNERGAAYTWLDQDIEAIKDFSRSIELDGKNAVAYRNRGSAYRRQGKLNEALADLNKSIALKPGYGLAYKTRGDIFTDLGKTKEANEDYRKAKELPTAKPAQ